MLQKVLIKEFAYLYIDVGGGSTELTFYENGKMVYEKSFNIGTIRLLNNLVTMDNWKEMKDEIKKKKYCQVKANCCYRFRRKISTKYSL